MELEHLDYVYKDGTPSRIEDENMFITFDEMEEVLLERYNITTLGNDPLGVFVDERGYKYNIYHMYDMDVEDPKLILCCTNFI